MLFDDAKFSQFLTDPVVADAKDKRSRLLYICNTLKMNNLIEKCCRVVIQRSKEHSKSEEVSGILLYKAMQKNKPEDGSSQVEEIVQILTKAILNAPYGGKTFNEAYALRAKCNLKLSKYEEALYDAEVALRYGHINLEQILVKAIALYSLKRYDDLRKFLLSDEVIAVPVDSKAEEQMKQMGFGHLTLNFLKNFKPADDNEENSEEKPDDDNQKMLKNVLNSEVNYVMDDRVAVMVDCYQGRYMIAKEFIPKGSTILVERSFSVGYNDKARHEYCVYCSARINGKSIPCKYCIDVIFCNESCQENAWNIFHQHECTLVSLFIDGNYQGCYQSEHMYRTLSRVGIWNALKVFDKVACLKADPEIVEKARSRATTAEQIVNDKIIDEFLANEDLRTISVPDQTEEHKILAYEMQCTLVDHNESFESHYDVYYMSTAVNVPLLLLLRDYLQKQNLDAPTPVLFGLINMEEIERMLEENEQCKVEDQLVFGYSMDTFLKLAEIIQYNIRKLGTNVFSWKYYDDDNAKHYIASCQVLIGSLINHSCIPNVDWDFFDGCISYTSLSDIQPGDEIQNSYGPHTGRKFFDRQKKLAHDYNFNCYCTACKADVIDYPDVLQCESCSGPVVILPNLTIRPTCMICHRDYVNANYRMQRVNEERATFKQLWRYFSQPSVLSRKHPQRNHKFVKFLAQLTKSIDYQLNYVYTYSRGLKYNLMLYCWLLVRIGKLAKATFYGQCAVNEIVPDLSEKFFYANDRNVDNTVRDILVNMFFLRLNEMYVANYHEVPEQDKFRYDLDQILYDTARKLIDHFDGIISKSISLKDPEFCDHILNAQIQLPISS